MIAYNIVDSEQGLNIVLMVDSKVYQISDSTHKNMKAVLAALRANAEDMVRQLITPVNFRSYVEAVKSGMEFKDGVLTFNGERLNSAIAKKIERFAAEQVPYTYLLNFLRLLLKNPDEKSVEQLYAFLERNDLPINADGYIMAYKGLHENYTSIHSGQGTVQYPDGSVESKDHWNIPNNVGNIVTVPREYVDSDPNSACSHGLHVGSLKYVQNFARGKVVICAVSPEHVVSVPRDSDYMKIRVCEYKVVDEFVEEIKTQVYTSNTNKVESADAEDLQSIKDALADRIKNVQHDRSQVYADFSTAVKRVQEVTGVSVKFVSEVLAPLDPGYGNAVRKSAIVKFLK